MSVNYLVLTSKTQPDLGVLSHIKDWWQTLHDRIVLWLASMDFNSMNIIEIAMFVGAGFLVGIILQRHLKGLVIFVILLAAAGWALQGLNLIVINWDYANQLTGTVSNLSLSNLLTISVDWAKEHLVQVAGFGVGLLIGTKV